MSTDKNLFIDLWLISFMTDRMVSEMLAESVLSVDEFALYGLITDLSPITAADIVRATGLPPTTVSSIVNRCERRGELVRTPNPHDARSSLLELTPPGYAALGQVVDGLLDGIDRMKSALGGQYQDVRGSLADLDGAMRRELGLGPRPYKLVASDGDGSSLNYEGAPLNEQQVKEARLFIDWLRDRDAQ